ncbi:dipeptidyl peptidase 9 isoform X2 [Anthonomus grandis grandis]|uniref:dipeptidyl peptidase 9 isoform X2 n=1 Tax=Anthonomus grandis grandis TaxID=2921223 RepID=UPI0021667EF9|nr:dipeptidyl peptidase 9 isoform X2 [Anthonomus grandis grandis]
MSFKSENINMDGDSRENLEEEKHKEISRQIDVQSRKLTWSELRTVVSELRRQLANLSTMIPTSFSFRTLPDGRTRIYFLSTPHNGWETTLLFTDIPNTKQPGSLRLQWQCVLEANFPCVTSCSRSSREEQLLWERKRLATWGINSYEIHEDSGKIVFPADSSLFQCVDSGFTHGQLFPTKLRMTSSGAKLNPQICPTNPELVAYICNHDIWVTHTVSGSNVRITYAHKGGRNLADDPLSAGVPSYVMQEEFCRYLGYWWQPKCIGGVYRIIYEEVDDGDVKLFCFPSSQSDTGEVEEFRFPRAGCPNSKSYLKLVEFKLNEHLQIVDLCLLDLQFSLRAMFPWIEYMVRVGWTPDAEYIWVQLLDRRQQHLELIILSLNNFSPDLPYFSHSSQQTVLSDEPVVQVIYSQESQYWINVHDLLYFLPSNEHEPIDCAPKILSKIQLTSGEWEVLSQNIWVNLDKELVYFMGLKETPLEKHLYVVSLKKPGEVRLLTRPGYSYAVEFNRDCSLLVTVYSNIQKPPACQVFRVDENEWTVEGVTLTPLGYLVESPGAICEMYSPTLYTYEIHSGQILYAMVFKPHNFTPDKKYPTILNVYGGPEVQLVSNTFKGMRQLRMHMLAARGYCVVAIDSRGSQHRGIQFEGFIKSRMGTVELKDQVEVLRWLADTLGYIDLNRIAIHGWSYGGYLSLMGLIQYPEVFKVAIAGAPVTNWNLYDTGYTERYMDLPSHNFDGYQEGSVLKYAHKFPDEENRLLIIHGLIDENVHFCHTSQLINCLVKAGKPYQLQIYPNERHSLRHLDSSKHYETTFLSFLQNYL